MNVVKVKAELAEYNPQGVIVYKRVPLTDFTYEELIKILYKQMDKTPTLSKSNERNTK